MSRRDDEPIDVARFATRAEAEDAWITLLDAGVPAAVLSDDPAWGEPVHRVQCARRDATNALALLGGPGSDSAHEL